MRLREAQALLKLGLYDGAYYLAGYAAECALKACIAKKTARYDFPDKKNVLESYTHVLRDLIKAAGLEGVRLGRAAQDEQFRNNWDIVQLWSEQSRYEAYDSERAGNLLRALDDRSHGIIPWLKHHW
ncbi:MAG: HEPN domain-containing protein [Bryobacteraceae bacterium]